MLNAGLAELGIQELAEFEETQRRSPYATHQKANKEDSSCRASQFSDTDSDTTVLSSIRQGTKSANQHLISKFLKPVEICNIASELEADDPHTKLDVLHY